MKTTDIRPCERKCCDCGEWKHHSRFSSYKTRHGRGGRTSTDSASLSFNPRCRDCVQKRRNEKKNANRPLAIIEQRAASAASRAGESRDFFWVQMNYRALVAPLAAFLGPEGLCLCCGHPFQNERDIQIEHIEPPRNAQDWARLHARNLRFSCGSCNRTKSAKDYDAWLDDQEGARLSNLERPTSKPEIEVLPMQGKLL